MRMHETILDGSLCYWWCFPTRKALEQVFDDIFHMLLLIWRCGARYPMLSPCFPMCCNWLRHLETIETQSETPVFFSAPLFRSVWWLMGGGILSTTTPWRVWRWSFGKCATALWHRHDSEVGKHSKFRHVFAIFWYVLTILPMPLCCLHICSIFIYFSSRYLILPLAKTTPAWKRPLATSQEAAFSKWSKTRHGRIVVYCKADTEIRGSIFLTRALYNRTSTTPFFVQAQECHAMLETVMRAVESLQECTAMF